MMSALDAVCEKDNGLKRRATVICRRDEQILFVRKRNAKWNLPGGRVERGETPLQAAMREMVEETGLTFDRLAYVSQYEEDNVIHFLFEAQRSGRQKPRPSNEIDACRWLNAKEASRRNVRAPIRSLLKRSASDVHDSQILLNAG